MRAKEIYVLPSHDNARSEPLQPVQFHHNLEKSVQYMYNVYVITNQTKKEDRLSVSVLSNIFFKSLLDTLDLRCMSGRSDDAIAFRSTALDGFFDGGGGLGGAVVLVRRFVDEIDVVFEAELAPTTRRSGFFRFTTFGSRSVASRLNVL